MDLICMRGSNAIAIADMIYLEPRCTISRTSHRQILVTLHDTSIREIIDKFHSIVGQ